MDPLSTYQTDNFFRNHSPITQSACHEKAIAIAGGGTAEPTHGQGAQSYTVRVTNGTKKVIVQFRGPECPLDVALVAAAQETYGQLVPSCEYLEGQLDPLHVYTMNDVPGVWYVSARDSVLRPENYQHLARTVRDFAVFCACAWRNKPSSMPPSSNLSIQLEYSSKLERLYNNLPDRFQPQLDKLKSHLPSLFEGDFPMVINHWDLLENNMHVDPQTGSLTGIVDWRDAEVGPFGAQFWGLENLISVRTIHGMRFHERDVELRQLFWETLYAQMGDVSEGVRVAIRAARMMGIYFANDFDMSLPMEGAVSHDSLLAVLESVTLGLPDIGL